MLRKGRRGGEEDLVIAVMTAETGDGVVVVVQRLMAHQER